MSRRTRDDSGAYMVMYALLAVGIFAVVALVLDIAALRQGRRADRAAADFAAAAGANVLDPIDPSTVDDACQAAWDYVVLNRDNAEGAVSAPPCTTTFPAATCDPATPATASGTYGPLTVSITYPVPDTDALMRAELAGGDAPQSIDAARDGEPCQRIAVRVQRTRTFLFGGIIGSESGRTDVHAVARRVLQSGADVPAAVAVETTGCESVRVAAGAALSILPTTPADPDAIAVDTDLSACPAPGVAVEVTGAVLAAGEIEAYTLVTPNAARTVGGITATPLTPVTTRFGRSFLDLRYDCGAPCGEAQGDLSALRAQYGTGVPAGLTTSTTCSVPSGTVITMSADTFVDCPELRIDGALTFTGARAVFNGNVVIGATGCLSVNAAGCPIVGGVGATRPEVVLYLRGSLVKENKGNLVLTNTLAYVAGGVSIPLADPFGTSEMRWTAPQSGPFEDLALWTDAATPVVLGEQQTTALEGTFVALGATIALEGKGSATPLAAQLVARRIHVQGGAPIILSPSAGRATGAVARQAKLIR